MNCMRLIIYLSKKKNYIYTYVCIYNFYLNKLFKFFILLEDIIMIIKTFNNFYWICIIYSLNFIVDNFFSLKIKQFQKVISITLFLQIYNFIMFFKFLVDIILLWNGAYSSNYCYYALYFPNFFWYN